MTVPIMFGPLSKYIELSMLSVCTNLLNTFRQDDKTAEELNIESGTTLHLVLALRGGQTTST
jgi:hypothetical protein